MLTQAEIDEAVVLLKLNKKLFKGNNMIFQLRHPLGEIRACSDTCTKLSI